MSSCIMVPVVDGNGDEQSAFEADVAFCTVTIVLGSVILIVHELCKSATPFAAMMDKITKYFSERKRRAS